LAIARSQFRTFAQAKRAVIELQKVIAEIDAFEAKMAGSIQLTPYSKLWIINLRLINTNNSLKKNKPRINN